MSYRHSMTCYTQGISAVRPVEWRAMDGMVSVHWQAMGQRGAQGYYLSPDPRIMFFFNDVSSHILISNSDAQTARAARPMLRAMYVPAGVPMWSRFSGQHRFSHLDLHIHKDRMLRFLQPSVGASTALAALHRPVEIAEPDVIQTLAGLLLNETAARSRHDVFAESLVGSIVTGLLDLTTPETRPAPGLSRAQMARLTALSDHAADRRICIAEMAAAVGLSESWFATVFKQTTGQTPQQWQMAQRIDRARRMLADTDLRLADVAAELGFSDQAHLTRVFRQIAGQPPGLWRKQQRARSRVPA